MAADVAGAAFLIYVWGVASWNTGLGCMLVWMGGLFALTVVRAGGF